MAQWSVLPRPGDRRDRLGEGIIHVARENALYWVDILGCRLNRLGLADNAYHEWAMPDLIGWVIERAAAPGFIAGLRTGFHHLTLDPFALVPIGDPEPDLPGNRLNDALADARGRIWAGTMSLDGSRDHGALYRLDHDGAWHRIDAPYRIANGPAISPDGRWLYHTDSARGVVYRFAVDDAGELGPRQTFVAFPDAWGSPDGMTTDREGGVWIAHWGAGCVSRFTPDGQRERWIDLPASQITRPCFGGPELDRLFVTSAADGVDEPLAGCVFEIDAGVAGLPPHRFGG
jgi:sugar lactone lactonase YvrE